MSAIPSSNSSAKLQKISETTKHFRNFFQKNFVNENPALFFNNPALFFNNPAFLRNNPRLFDDNPRLLDNNAWLLS